ncbi:MAG: hypothetical protein HYR71_01560 [Chloroflexi bacterium]|nr:hypothetical protein [Chloroflexota bacterium]
MALSFASDIRPLFRQTDIDEMISNGGFNLSKYDDVKKHAKDIYQRTKDGDMPCDKPWSQDNVKKFKEWLDAGMLP